MSSANALALIAADMAEVDRVIAHRLDSGVPLVGTVSQYIISAGGKRVRPAPMGRAYRVVKRTAHLTVRVAERPLKIARVGETKTSKTAAAAKA